MNRVRQYVALARHRNESRRLGQALALPLAGFVAIVCVQMAILSANDRLTLSAASPMIWLTICFTGLLAVFMSLHQR